MNVDSDLEGLFQGPNFFWPLPASFTQAEQFPAPDNMPPVFQFARSRATD